MLYVSCDFPSAPCLRRPVLGDSASSTYPTCCAYCAELAVQSLPPAQILIPVDCGSWVYSELCSLGLPCPHCHLHPGLTRDPGLDILPPDLFLLLASLPLKSTWEKIFLWGLKIFRLGSSSSSGL